MAMKAPPHPGLSVRHDCIEPLGLTVSKTAKCLGISRKQLSDIINGCAGLSPEMAIRLDKAFGGGAETSYRLQAAYNLAAVTFPVFLISVQHAERTLKMLATEIFAVQHKRITPEANLNLPEDKECSYSVSISALTSPPDRARIELNG